MSTRKNEMLTYFEYAKNRINIDKINYRQQCQQDIYK